MNRLTKKVLISVFTWIMIFITLGTSTFAWFSMNYSVSATDLNIVVKSNATYLLIGDNPGIATNKLGLTKQCAAGFVSGGDEDKKVYPAFYGDGTVLGTSVQSQVTTEVGKWYTASNLDSSSSTSNVVNVVQVVPENEWMYMLTYKVYLTLSGDSLPYEKPLKITFEQVSGDDSVSAVIVLTTTTNDESTTEKFPLNVDNTFGMTTGNIFVSKDTAYEITILVYINGNGENVNSDYFNLHGVTGQFNLNFDIIA